MKKFLSLTLAASMSLALLAGCGSSGGNASGSGSGDGSNASAGSIKVAAIETSYGTEVWQQVCDAFTEQTGIAVELVTDKKLEDVIGPAMQGGEYPDVVHLAVGREAGLTEQFIKDKNIEEITDVLSMTIPGESGTVGDKIIPGFVNDNSTTNPYADGKTYLAPMFYSPCGLFYNKGLFEEKGWEVPTTWDEMWALGDKAQAEGISLFTYPTTGYFDAFFYALMYEAGGEDFFYKATHYEEGIWDSEAAQTCFDIVEKLASYTNPITPAQANDQDFTQNQQLVLDNKALFMPNGTWIVSEMAEAPRADGFEWGMTALPAITSGGDRYSYTFFEQMWIPAGAANKDAAKQFIAFMYSDTAADLFAAAGAAQPVTGIVDKLSGDNQIFYGIYDDGAKAALGAFASYKSVAGLGTQREVFFDPVNALVSGSMTKDEWVSSIKTASDQMRANLT